MNFNKNLDWLKESDEENLLADDDLDMVNGDEEQINEVRYIDPANVDKYDSSEIEKVKDAQGNDRYKRKTGEPSTQKKDEPVQKKDEPAASNASQYYKEIADIDKELSRIDKKIKSGTSFDSLQLKSKRASLVAQKDAVQKLLDAESSASDKDKKSKTTDLYVSRDPNPKTRAQSMYTTVNNVLGDQVWDDLMSDAEQSKVGSKQFYNNEEPFSSKWQSVLGDRLYEDFIYLYDQGYFN